VNDVVLIEPIAQFGRSRQITIIMDGVSHGKARFIAPFLAALLRTVFQRA